MECGSGTPKNSVCFTFLLARPLPRKGRFSTGCASALTISSCLPSSWIGLFSCASTSSGISSLGSLSSGSRLAGAYSQPCLLRYDLHGRLQKRSRSWCRRNHRARQHRPISPRLEATRQHFSLPSRSLRHIFFPSRNAASHSSVKK